MSARWKVRKWRSRHGPTTIHVWEVFEPDGTPSGACESWSEAMEWATSFAARVEYWLENQR